MATGAHTIPWASTTYGLLEQVTYTLRHGDHIWVKGPDGTRVGQLHLSARQGYGRSAHQFGSANEAGKGRIGKTKPVFRINLQHAGFNKGMKRQEHCIYVRIKIKRSLSMRIDPEARNEV